MAQGESFGGAVGPAKPVDQGFLQGALGGLSSTGEVEAPAQHLAGAAIDYPQGFSSQSHWPTQPDLPDIQPESQIGFQPLMPDTHKYTRTNKKKHRIITSKQVNK